MGKVQHRRSISVKGATYTAFRAACDAEGVAMSAALEEMIADRLRRRSGVEAIGRVIPVLRQVMERETKPKREPKPEPARVVKGGPRDGTDSPTSTRAPAKVAVPARAKEWLL